MHLYNNTVLCKYVNYAFTQGAASCKHECGWFSYNCDWLLHSGCALQDPAQFWIVWDGSVQLLWARLANASASASTKCTKSINMKGGLSFTATTSRLQLAYACLVGGQMLTLPVSSYMLHMCKRGILPRLPVTCKSIHNFLSGQEVQSQSFDKMTLGISWYSVSPYFSRRMSPGASNAAPQCSENLCGCCRFLSCQELSHDLPQIFRSRQARDGSKVDDLDMFGALGRFTVFRC